jgi:hypothetical protein
MKKCIRNQIKVFKMAKTIHRLYVCFLSLAAAGVWESTARAGGCSAAFPTPYRPPNPRSLGKRDTRRDEQARAFKLSYVKLSFR